MAASTPSAPTGTAVAPSSGCFNREEVDAASGEATLHWLLKKNCSTTPGQLLGAYFLLAAMSLGIAVGFWLQGATLVLPFAGAELLVLGAALWIHARHAADGEDIRLGQRRLTVASNIGGRVERVQFQRSWVRVEPEHGDRSLIELSGQGRRIVVGRFVAPGLRRQLAEEIRWALRRWQPMPAPAAA